MPCLALAGLLLAACASTPPPIAPAAAASAAAGARPDAHDPRLRAAAAVALPSPLVVPVDAATRAALPRETVTAHAHGRSLRCSGVPLAALLRRAGALLSPPSPALPTRYVRADARDGSRVLFSLAELDPTLGGRGAWLVDRCDGAPLPEDDGPLRLIVPDDARPARWLRQVTAITVIAAP